MAAIKAGVFVMEEGIISHMRGSVILKTGLTCGMRPLAGADRLADPVNLLRF